MAKKQIDSPVENLPVPIELIERRIYLIGGHKVMLDTDLAELYQVSTKAFNQAVKRNVARFPEDFMFQLSAAESATMRSYSVTASRRNVRFRPYAFTELGVAMLSSVLNSERAVQMNILIMRAFVQPNFNGTKLGNLSVPIRPLKEQRRIVARLNSLFKRSKSAREELARIPKLVERYKKALLLDACSGKLTAGWRATNPHSEPATAILERIKPATQLKTHPEALGRPSDLPTTWSLVSLESIVQIQNGRAFPSGEYAESGVKLLRPGNLHESGEVVWTGRNTAMLPSHWGDEYPDFVLGAGELLMNLTAQSLKDDFLGRVCLKADAQPALLNQRIARFVNLGPDDLRPYLLLYLKSPLFRSYVDTLDSGSLIRHMHTRQVMKHVVPLPPVAEQAEIIRQVRQQFAAFDLAVEHTRRSTILLDRLQQAALTEAFRGELFAPSSERI